MQTSDNKYIRFADALLFFIFFETAVVLLLQSFHVFRQPAVFLVHVIGILVCLIYFRKWPKWTIKTDWVLLLVSAISIFSLSQVHYNYTGKIIDREDQFRTVSNLSYRYPYYSDEWYAIAFIKQAINTHGLPLHNPFFKDQPFTNLEFVSHAFLSEMMQLFCLDPLEDYTKLSIVVNTLIIILIYTYLRFIKITAMTAGIAALSALYITNGANLPGLWTLLPVTLGIIPLLLCLFYFEQRNKRLVLASVFIALIFYPPLIVLLGPAYGVFIFNNSSKNRVRDITWFMLMAFAVAAVLLIAMAMTRASLDQIFSYIHSKIFYGAFETNAFPNLAILNVVPMPIVLLSFLALLNKSSNRSGIIPMIMTGLIFWIFYSIVPKRFIIEYERIVYVVSILLVLLSGIGLERAFMILSNNALLCQLRGIALIQWGILIVMLISAFSYTAREGWRKITLYSPDLKMIYYPAAPANMFLSPDDLRIFKDIHDKSFLSTPWKGTAIGTATDNNARCTKPGTVTVNPELYDVFMNADCHAKEKIAIEKRIKYFYVEGISCPGFTLIDKSNEGFALYDYH